MATDLTPELRQALASSDGPLEFIDSHTNRHYVLIQSEVYERLKAILDVAEPSATEKDADLKAWAQRSGYFEPSMDAYDSIKPQQ